MTTSHQPQQCYADAETTFTVRLHNTSTMLAQYITLGMALMSVKCQHFQYNNATSGKQQQHQDDNGNVRTT
jgi:hypothetical protein